MAAPLFRRLLRLLLRLLTLTEILPVLFRLGLHALLIEPLGVFLVGFGGIFDLFRRLAAAALEFSHHALFFPVARNALAVPCLSLCLAHPVILRPTRDLIGAFGLLIGRRRGVNPLVREACRVVIELFKVDVHIVRRHGHARFLRLLRRIERIPAILFRLLRLLSQKPLYLAEQVVDLLIVIFYVKVIHARCSFLRSSEAPPSAKFIQNDTLLYQIFTVL